ncbi:Semaphorin-4E [Liparis tanakae]|uniref:Semaphorin-4E n=1 Tax=Liparis tanakae TaxID=230148 RepID=A0A4Z2HPS2_9TELE|nr:Semaphorin-4E [Liparis tanakae]
MSLLSALSIVCGLTLHVSHAAPNTHYCVPRKTVPYHSELKLFREEGIFNYSTMLMRDDLGVLLLGAREAVYALDIDDVSVRKSAVYWRVTEEKQRECTYKGKNAEVECHPAAAVDFTLVPENNIQLPCQLHSNLARVLWRFAGRTLRSGDKYYIYGGGLLILGATETDVGRYSCDSVELINGRAYNRTVAVYRLRLDPGAAAGAAGAGGAGGAGATTLATSVATRPSDSTAGPSAAPPPGPAPNPEDPPPPPENQSDTGKMTRLEVAVALLALLCLGLMGVLFWTWTHGRTMGCFKMAKGAGEGDGKRQPAEYVHIPNRTSEIKFLGPQPGRPNNNHSAVDFKGSNGEHRFTPMANISSLDGLGYINDESEI